jgi:acyl-homoserine-lactone acylase
MVIQHLPMKKITLYLLLLHCFITVAAQPVNPQNIDIVRDSFGVPHIFAKTDAEVAYGLAWAHAEDDFESLQMVGLPAKGLMGKVLGKAGAAGDYAFALFRCKEITEEKWNTLSPGFIKLAEGYVQGLNAYAKAHPQELLTKKLFPYTVKEYVSSSVFALTIFNGADKALQAIFGNKTEVLPELNKKGSNSMAVHKSKTTTGENYLLVNAHQPNTGSQAFYEAHICSEEGLNVLGGLLAAGPCILHGVNENLGWAHTVNFCDRVDMFQLQMNPDNKLQYWFDDHWETLEQKKVKLKIKGVPVKVGRSVYWSKYGATMKNKLGFYSIRLGANMRIGALDQWYQMNRARNYTEFYQALSRQELSMFNIMYADRHDTIFYINNALMPVRNPAPQYNWKKLLPGNTAATLWTQFRGIKELPQYVNPASGYLFNTNHSSFLATSEKSNLKASAFAAQDGWEQYHLNRSVRVMELMPKDGDPLSYGQFKRIKFDRQLPAQLQYPYKLDSMLLAPTGDSVLDGLVSVFKNWDKKGDPGSRGGALFLLTYLHLSKALAGQPSRYVTLAEATETWQWIKDYLVSNFNKTDITLGQLQRLVRGNEDFPLGGFPDLLSPQWTEPYQNGQVKSVGGDGYIMFIRFNPGQLPKIETLNMYGASSHPGNKHFADQVPLYLQQKTKPMTLDKQEVYQKAERVYHPG